MEPGWYWTKFNKTEWVPDYWDGLNWQDESMNDSYFHGEELIIGPRIEKPVEIK